MPTFIDSIIMHYLHFMLKLLLLLLLFRFFFIFFLQTLTKYKNNLVNNYSVITLKVAGAGAYLCFMLLT